MMEAVLSRVLNFHISLTLLTRLLSQVQIKKVVFEHTISALKSLGVLSVCQRNVKVESSAHPPPSLPPDRKKNGGRHFCQVVSARVSSCQLVSARVSGTNSALPGGGANDLRKKVLV